MNESLQKKREKSVMSDYEFGGGLRAPLSAPTSVFCSIYLLKQKEIFDAVH